MADYREAFVGIDVLKNAIAIAESGRDGEVRYFGEVEASDASMRRIVQRIVAKFDRVHFCYEAGPTGYGLHRLIRSLDQSCMVCRSVVDPEEAWRPGEDEPSRGRDTWLDILARLDELRRDVRGNVPLSAVVGKYVLYAGLMPRKHKFHRKPC